MTYLEQWLCLVAIHSTVLLGTATLVCQAKRLHPAARHAVGAFAISSSLLLPVWIVVLPPTLSNLLVTAHNNAPSQTNIETRLPSDSQRERPADINSYSTSEMDVAWLDTSAPVYSSSKVMFDVRPRWAIFAIGIWLVGALVILYRQAAAAKRLSVLLQSAKRIEPPAPLLGHLQRVFGKLAPFQLLQSDSISSPFVCGCLRYRIYIPTELLSDSERLKQVITHEVSHLHRRDPITLAIQQIATGVFWWQPLTFVINREISKCREWIADRYVLQNCEPLSYAETLLRFAERKAGLGSMQALAFFDRSALEWRINEILHSKYALSNRCMPSSLLSVLFLFLIATATGGVFVSDRALNAQDQRKSTSTTTGNAPAELTSPAASSSDASNDAATAATASPAAASPSEQNPVPSAANKERDDGEQVLEGTVLDSLGQPVADCQVIEQVRGPNSQSDTGSTTTNQDGYFRLIRKKPRDGREWMHITWFYKPGHGLKAVMLADRSKRQDSTLKVNIHLPQVTPIAVQVVDESEKPMRDVSVGVSTMTATVWLTTDEHRGSEVGLPTKLSSLSVKTDENGRATLNDYNSKLVRRLTAFSKDYGRQNIDLKNAVPKIKLRPTTEVNCKIVAEDPSKYEGTDLILVSQVEDPHEAGAVNYSIETVKFDSQGEATVQNLGTGNLHIWAKRWPHMNEGLPVGPVREKLIAGERKQIQIRIAKSTELSGKIVGADNQLPLADIGIAVIPDFPTTSGQRVLINHSAWTDREGNYRLFTIPGKTRLRLVSVHGNGQAKYDSPFEEPTMTVSSVSGDVQWPTIALPLVQKSTIHLHDKQNQAIPKVEVILAGDIDGQIRYLLEFSTDPQGVAIISHDLKRVFDGRVPYYYFFKGDFDEREPDKNKALEIVRKEANSIWIRKR